MSDAMRGVNLRHTPQSEAADPSQIQNNAGGFVFGVTPETRIHRFLTLGTDGGTYYVGEKSHTKENAGIVLDWARNRTTELVDEVVKVSTEGLAPRQNPGVFALAAAASFGDELGRRAAFDAIPKVCRTGTTYFMLRDYADNMRGWGNGFKRAMGRWYLDKSVDDLAYQVLKYRQRDGMTHRDMLRLTHPPTTDEARRALFSWITHPDDGVTDPDTQPALVAAFLQAQKATTVDAWVHLIGAGLSWEMLPTAALNERKVWEALILKGMPQTALMRQLPRLTRLGLFDAPSVIRDVVCEQLQSSERLVKARVHPVGVLIAAKTYAKGRSELSDKTWNPVGQIVDALDTAFYNSFGSVRKTGKNILLALDVSGSMCSNNIIDPSSQTVGVHPGLNRRTRYFPVSPREVSAALALVTLSVEPNTTVVGFTGNGSQYYSDYHRQHVESLKVLSLSPRQRLNDAVAYIDSLPFGATDCALPAMWAKSHGHRFDAISIYTDSETWAGGEMQPFQALRDYRNATGTDVRQVVVGMTATEFTIADPSDPLSLDVAGFDSAVPNLLADFAAGDV
jgi:60 kDa SS-A/Ro ribonucleoprotein